MASLNNNSTNLWIFGYGSLCWYPGFPVSKSHIGYVKNYVRRFWQGNTTHRGIPGKPGRVATLIPEENGVTWGVAYEISNQDAYEYLNQREVTLGGYAMEIVEFYPQSTSKPPFPVLLYIATDSSKDWLGPSPMQDIALQILHSSGPSGHNVEYLLRLGECMRKIIPDGYDDHLEKLETLVRFEIKKRNLNYCALMGECPNDCSTTEQQELDVQGEENQDQQPSGQFSSKIPKTHLRCCAV